MKLIEALDLAADVLRSRREAQYLLTALFDGNLAELLAHPEREMQQKEEFHRWLAARSQGVPLAYLRGWQEFYGRRFAVDERVLIPRPETELLVQESLRLARDRWRGRLLIGEVGTGSGCISVSLALELPDALVWAIDISLDALAMARENVERNQVGSRVRLLRGDLLEAIPGPLDMVVANLPYVATEWVRVEPSIAFEPKQALDGGPLGEDLLMRLLRQSRSWLRGGGCLLLEIGDSHGHLARAAESVLPGAQAEVLSDLAGLPRLLRVLMP